MPKPQSALHGLLRQKLQTLLISYAESTRNAKISKVASCLRFFKEKGYVQPFSIYHLEEFCSFLAGAGFKDVTNAYFGQLQDMLFFLNLADTTFSMNSAIAYCRRRVKLRQTRNKPRKAPLVDFSIGSLRRSSFDASG